MAGTHGNSQKQMLTGGDSAHGQRRRGKASRRDGDGERLAEASQRGARGRRRGPCSALVMELRLRGNAILQQMEEAKQTREEKGLEASTPDSEVSSVQPADDDIPVPQQASTWMRGGTDGAAGKADCGFDGYAVDVLSTDTSVLEPWPDHLYESVESLLQGDAWAELDDGDWEAACRAHDNSIPSNGAEGPCSSRVRDVTMPWFIPVDSKEPIACPDPVKVNVDMLHCSKAYPSSIIEMGYPMPVPL